MNLQNRFAIKKPHSVGGSVVVTIDPTLVRELRIDDTTFFLQEPVEGGILLKLRRLS